MGLIMRGDSRITSEDIPQKASAAIRILVLRNCITEPRSREQSRKIYMVPSAVLFFLYLYRCT